MLSNNFHRRSSPSLEPEVNERENESFSHPKHTGWGTRHTLVLLGFWGFVVSYAMRVNLSFAIVAMVDQKSSPTANTSIDACPNLSNLSQFENGMSMFSEPENYTGGEFDWDGEEQGIILGAFFWGYVITQVPGGMLSEKIGGKWPFGIGMLITAIFSLLTPLAARTGKGVLVTVRIIQGLGEGVTNPAMHALLARWLAPMERSKMVAFVYSGTQIGTVLAMPLCGFLISSGFMGGWPSVFYVIGFSGIIWFIFWTIYVHSTPAAHPRIDSRELSYIQHSIGAQASNVKVKTPWIKIFTSVHVWAILIAQTGHGWGLYTLLTELPTYMKTILHYNFKASGWLSALPYFSMFLCSIACSFCADKLREQKIISITAVRKIFNCIAHWIPAIALVLAGYSNCDRVLTMILLTIAVGATGAHYSSFHVNHIDLAPNHAAVMMGITNGIANTCGILAPYVAGVIIKDGGSLADWKLIFLISATIYIVDNIFFVLFASGEEQEWNRDLHAESKSNLWEERDPLLYPSSE